MSTMKENTGLVEREALAKIIGKSFYGSAWGQLTAMAKGECQRTADAVLAALTVQGSGREAVIEECVRAVEAEKLGRGGMLSGTGMAAVHDGALNDAIAALRSLSTIPQPQDLPSAPKEDVK